MKLNRMIVAAMAALMFVTGCDREQEEQTPVKTDAPRIVAEMADEPATRTCIDSDALVAGENTAVLWTPGDRLGVFSTGSGNVLYTNDEKTESVPNTSFSSSDEVVGEIQYAYYPYDSANNGKEAGKLVGCIPTKQNMGQSIPADYKFGKLRGTAQDGDYRFKFHNMFSLVRFKIDATGTDLEGKILEKVCLKVTRENADAPAVTGDFTFSAIDGSFSVTNPSNVLSTVWNQKLEGEISSFATVFPEIRKGDKLTFTFSSGDYNTSFTVTSKADFEPKMYYTFPLKLATFAANKEKYGYQTTLRAQITKFWFEVEDNEGKLLDNQLVWNDSDNPQFNDVTKHDAVISGSNISLMIPYLFDFTLVPSFELSGDYTVSVNGETMTSGESGVDFTNPVTFTVSSDDDERDYSVTLNNTGLPVVVLKQSSSGDFSKAYINVKEIFGIQISGTLVNEFVDFWVRGKGTTWQTDDQMTVYNPDGTVNMPTTMCGAKLRGNTSQAYPKKPFAVKLNSKASILGMPAHKRWVLLANWLDHSMIRNTVALDIAHAIEDAWKNNSDKIGPGIPRNVHGQNVELVFVESDGTGHHVGNYFLCEQIKIDKDRLNIRKPYEDVTNPTFETCGYLLEVDNNYDEEYQFKTSNGVPIMFKDALPDNTILNKVQSKIKSMEDKIDAGKYSEAYAYLDINSVIDQMLIWELTMNREYGDPRSVYMFMDGDGKLSAGPVWDFDRATFQNTTNAKSMGNKDRVKPYDQWMYWRSAESEGCSYIWYRQLAKDPIFQAAVKERWAVIYPYLQRVSEKISEYGRTMKASYEVDSKMWPTDKDAILEHKSGFTDWSGDELLGADGNYQEVIDNLIDVFEDRLSGMNTLITNGTFTK